jgi:predicted transposase YbfD/YdcC
MMGMGYIKLNCSRDQGGDFVLALKGNPGTLHQEVRALLEAQAQNEAPGDVKVEKGHGRLETRRVWVTDRVDWIDPRSTFPGLKTLVMVESEREMANGKKSVERRCFLSSLPPGAERLGQKVRAHWGGGGGWSSLGAGHGVQRIPVPYPRRLRCRKHGHHPPLRGQSSETGHHLQTGRQKQTLTHGL